MRLNVKALAMAAALLWAVAVFFTGLINLVRPEYGSAFLQMLASLYPGYHGGASVGDLIVGSGYALVDGGICGMIFGWLYNLLVG